MAENLGIPEKIRQEPCNYKGECSGTCPACYKEEQILMERIYELYQTGMMDMVYGDKNSQLKVEIESKFDDLTMGDVLDEEEIVDDTLDEIDEQNDFLTDIFGKSDDKVGSVTPYKPNNTFGGIRPPSEDEAFNPAKTTYSFLNTENNERLTFPPFRPGNIPAPPMSGQILTSPEYFNMKQAKNKTKKHGIFGKKDKNNGKI